MNVHYECGHVEFDSSTTNTYIERVCDHCLVELIDDNPDTIEPEQDISLWSAEEIAERLYGIKQEKGRVIS